MPRRATPREIVNMLDEQIVARLEKAASALREKYPRLTITTHSS
jgi:ATP-dependent protease HslVU (ClpYQ) ATPase subunit